MRELQRGIQQLDNIAVEQSPDQVDESQSSSDRELAISNMTAIQGNCETLGLLCAGSGRAPSEFAKNVKGHPSQAPCCYSVGPHFVSCVKKLLERRHEAMEVQPLTL